MASISKFRLEIGASSHCKLKKTSPFATLLLDVSSALQEEDISQLKLALMVDKHITKKMRCTLKHAADVMLFLYDNRLISTTDTHFLEQLLNKIGRKDIECLINKYHQRRQAQDQQQINVSPETTPKTVFSGPDQSFTHLKPSQTESSPDKLTMTSLHTPLKEVWSPGRPGGSNQGSTNGRPGSSNQGSANGRDQAGIGVTSHVSSSTSVQQHPWFSSQPGAFGQFRTEPEGMSSARLTNVENKPPSQEMTEEDWIGSQMSVDSSQKSASQMSMSDDDKVSYLNDKVWPNNTDDTSMASM